jgi:hypothetical protein
MSLQPNRDLQIIYMSTVLENDEQKEHAQINISIFISCR